MKGFTIIEVLVAILITAIAIVGYAMLLTSFGIFNRDKALLSCLTQGASSAMEVCRDRRNPLANFSCRGFNINISVRGSCQPATNQCNSVTVTAQHGNKRYDLTDMVCNF
ncbi:MAG: prepilin-type N-terminal cleavage/methylation domain-containing protein [Caldimicrobium sp.]|nr:prepilin-type N-terminal cleavage/methylation domain-containing protein [Caldimicrobium sp.]MCX7614063.1 prepilin-type N-terminal cleavage/methylation domain-containing protein [Caldimicrobium sp.]MDW8182858.1 prepilin-type N-terminal cleavage/methylation domain-containing protein [Caldimicrobium sp.]